MVFGICLSSFNQVGKDKTEPQKTDPSATEPWLEDYHVRVTLDRYFWDVRHKDNEFRL